MITFQECQALRCRYPFISSSYDDDSVNNHLFYVTITEDIQIITSIDSMVYISGGKITPEDLTGHNRRAESHFQEIYGFKISEYTRYFRDKDSLNEFLYKLSIALKYKWRIEKNSNPGILSFSDNEYILNFHRTEDVAKMRVSHLKDFPSPLVGDYLLSEMESILIKIRQKRLLEKKLRLEKTLEEVNQELASIK